MIETSFAFLLNNLQKTKEITPNAIPLEIEYENGITIIVINAGIPSVGSSKSIFITGFIIKYPTKINAGAVAADGIIANKSVKNNATMNKIAVTTDLRGGEMFSEINNTLNLIKDRGITPYVLFLDASNEELIRRFKENRSK